MELAAEYKRKYDEEQKQKAEELAKQNIFTFINYFAHSAVINLLPYSPIVF